MHKQNKFEFSIQTYGATEKYNDVITKARCRIFYKGANRNRTFITDAFAKELIASLHYVPVKGIFNTGSDDFEDHGKSRQEGRIYGIVPETNNFAWEQHLDEDGIERTYACSDVLLFTGLYPDAEKIPGKSQSMELYYPSLEYHETMIDNREYIVFDHGVFLGLQALGDDVEPCFEGASFFSLQNSVKEIAEKLNNFCEKGGELEMHKINFNISDNEKRQKIFDLLNTNYNEEGNWLVEFGILDVYDEYAITIDYNSSEYYKVYYTKEEDEVTISKKEKCYMIYVNESEKATVDTLKKLNGDTYELVNENLTNAEENAQNCIELNSKIEEITEDNSTLLTEKQNIESELTATKTQYTTVVEERDNLASQVEELSQYKANIEDEHKRAVIDEYSANLSEEIIEDYRTRLGEFSIEDLDMHLAYELKKTGKLLKDSENGYVPKNRVVSTLDEILEKYKK